MAYWTFFWEGRFRQASICVAKSAFAAPVRPTANTAVITNSFFVLLFIELRFFTTDAHIIQVSMVQCLFLHKSLFDG